jgi:hypothetical protein
VEEEERGLDLRPLSLDPLAGRFREGGCRCLCGERRRILLDCFPFLWLVGRPDRLSRARVDRRRGCAAEMEPKTEDVVSLVLRCGLRRKKVLRSEQKRYSD